MGERSRDRVGETLPPPAPGAPWAARCVAESRAYIVRVCGPDVPSPVVEEAVTEVARLCGDGSPAAATVERIRATVREAALGEAERAARRPGARLGRLARRSFGCASVPGLLRKRASGRLSATEVVSLYQRLDRCPECARLTGRFDAAEWHLQQALVRPARAATEDSEAPAAPTPPVPTARETPAAGGRPPAAADPEPPGAPPAATRRRSPDPDAPAPRRPTPPPARGPGSPGRRRPAGAPLPATNGGGPPQEVRRRIPPPRLPVGRPAARPAALPRAPRPRRRGARPGPRSLTRAALIAAAAVIVLGGGGALVASGALDSGHAKSSGVISPASRRPLARVPVTPASAAGHALPGVPRRGLVLGSAPSTAVVPEAADAIAGATVVGSATGP